MRLIDADKLAGEAVCLYTYGGARFIPLDALKRAPTVEQPRWVSVKERLPECGEIKVVSTRDGLINTAYYDGDWHGMVCGDEITHWLDGLKMPKED